MAVQQATATSATLDVHSFLGTNSDEELRHMRMLSHLCAQTYYMGQLTVSATEANCLSSACACSAVGATAVVHPSLVGVGVSLETVGASIASALLCISVVSSLLVLTFPLLRVPWLSICACSLPGCSGGMGLSWCPPPSAVSALCSR